MDGDHNPASCQTYLEYLGIAGATKDCAQAVEQLLHYDREITETLILTVERGTNARHALLLTDNFGGQIAIKSGFSSGYGGGGPRGFSATLALLHWHGVKLDEISIDAEMLERLDASALTLGDLEAIAAARRVQPQTLWDYVLEQDDFGRDTINPWRDREPVIPFAILDDRLAAAAREFWDDPDGKLMKAHRLLEETIRKKACISIEDAASGGPARMYAAAFNGKTPKLGWPSITSSEHTGRTGLFLGLMQAYRHPRAHRDERASQAEHLRELLLLNHLFTLEREAVFMDGREVGASA
jgi:hypothetical protein